MRKESWEACVEAQKEGFVKSIGVSNFGVGHLNEMLAYGNGMPLPSVNQVCEIFCHNLRELKTPTLGGLASVSNKGRYSRNVQET